ncbi:MAG: TldD/PmbA family protein [Candidatus Hodarchaeales archaeon]|jgi:PmbA protein
MEITSDQLIALAQFVNQKSKTAGMDGSFVSARLNQVFSTRFANSAIHQNFADFETSVQICLIHGKKRITLTTNSMKEARVAEVVDKGLQLINILPDDPNFPGILTESQQYAKLQLNDPKAKNLEPSDVADKIIAGINTAHEFSDNVKTVSGNINVRDGLSYYSSSEGHENLTPTTAIVATINTMADDGKGEARSNSAFGGRYFAKLPFEPEAERAAERAVLGLNAQDIEPKETTVILDFQAAADQMFWVGFCHSAKFILDHLSFLTDKIGERVFSEAMTLINDPHNPELLAAAALDGEGVATKKLTLVQNGVVENFAHDRQTASEMGTVTNGCGILMKHFGFIPFPFALALQPGDNSRQKLIEGVDDGFLVTNLHYTNMVDWARGIQTGMTRDGLFMIKNGEIVGSARNLRFTDSISERLQSAELSKEVSQVPGMFGSSVAVPSMRLESMKFASKALH